MTSVLVLGGVSFDTIIYLDALPQPVPGTIFTRGFHETVGSTGAGKALNLAKLVWMSRRMIDEGKQLVVCTHGKHGATALTAAGEWIEQPSIPAYSFKDSNGAGDAFFAGVLYGHTRGYAPWQCLRLGALMGGLCITTQELALPTLDPGLLAAEYHHAYGELL